MIRRTNRPSGKIVIQALCALALGLFTATAHAAASFQTYQSADVVLGQPDFISSTPAFTDSLMQEPGGVAWDSASGKLFVADTNNNRILRFSSVAAAQSGSSAEAVFGQPDFTSRMANQGGTASAATLNLPRGIILDSSGRLWVADSHNNRVLRFDNAATKASSASADGVLGQPDFVTTNTIAVAQDTLGATHFVAIGPNGELWVSDAANRVLRFDNAAGKANGALADGVLGQPNFTNFGFGTSASELNAPYGIHADAAGRLWVVDFGNNRVLRFDNASGKSNGAAANGVLGQPNFTANADGNSASEMSDPRFAYSDADGNLWVSESGNVRVIRFSAAASLPDGSAADLVLGKPDFTDPDPTETSAQSFAGPRQISRGPGGSLFIADAQNCRVLRFSPIAPFPHPQPPPRISITGKKKITTPASKITLKGVATHAAKVEVKVGTAKYKPAKGASTWKFTATLKPGRNTILVRAVNADGVASKPVKFIVTRK